MPKKPLTEKQLQWDKEWAKEYKRIWDAAKDYMKRGYELADSFFPKRPKQRKAASLEKIKRFRGEKEYLKHVTYTSPLTGEVYKGKKAKAEYHRYKEYQEQQPPTPQVPPEEPEEDYTPSFDPVEHVREMLESLFSTSIRDLDEAPHYRRIDGKMKDQWPDRDYVKGVINKHMYFNSVEEAQEYAAHIEANLSELNEEIYNAFYLESSSWLVQKSITTAINIITQSQMTPEMSEAVDEEFDYDYGIASEE